jgi:hypothetical protein
MDLTQAKNILKNHNYWRRGAEIPMLEPKLIGEALDVAIELLETMTPDTMPICRVCDSDKTYMTTAYYCKRCSTTTEF